MEASKAHFFTLYLNNDLSAINMSYFLHNLKNLFYSEFGIQKKW